MVYDTNIKLATLWAAFNFKVNTAKILSYIVKKLVIKLGFDVFSVKCSNKVWEDLKLAVNLCFYTRT